MFRGGVNADAVITGLGHVAKQGGPFFAGVRVQINHGTPFNAPVKANAWRIRLVAEGENAIEPAFFGKGLTGEGFDDDVLAETAEIDRQPG